VVLLRKSIPQKTNLQTAAELGVSCLRRKNIIINIERIMEDTEKLLKIYELTLQEERFYIEGHTKRVAFWAGFIATILAGTTIGLLKAKNHWEFFGLSIGPIMTIAIAWLGKNSSFRWYQRFIECITKIAII
jgi:hypothetical protein